MSPSSSSASSSRPSLAGLFVAGTDTGVGKTIVAAALLRCAQRRGLHLIPYKPVETGVASIPEDAARLLEAAGTAMSLADVCPHPFRLPAAPQAAAFAEGVTLSLASLLAHAQRLATLGVGLVVESAGGLLAPYAPGVTGADLARALRLPILLVARTGLGTINHVALSLNEIRRRQLPLAALILVDTQPDRRPHESSNAPLIDQLTGVRPLAVLPYLDEPTADRLATALTLALTGPDLDRLLDLAASPPAD